jgi:hypothetical protein
MLENVDEQAEVSVDKVFPRPGFVPQASLKQAAVNFRWRQTTFPGLNRPRKLGPKKTAVRIKFTRGIPREQDASEQDVADVSKDRSRPVPGFPLAGNRNTVA